MTATDDGQPAVPPINDNWGGRRCDVCGLPVVRSILSTDTEEVLVHADRLAVTEPHNVVLKGNAS